MGAPAYLKTLGFKKQIERDPDGFAYRIEDKAAPIPSNVQHPGSQPVGAIRGRQSRDVRAFCKRRFAQKENRP